ncbi:MAG: hypothetical protein ACI8XO_003946 [Verrucomicrobiales bacterium]|jgi:hypothetical protein
METSPFDRLVSGLNHDDFFVRSTALQIICEHPVPGIEATRNAIAAIDRFGVRDAFVYPYQIGALPQDRKTLSWATEKLRTFGDKASDDTFPFHLATWIANAPTDLLEESEMVLELLEPNPLTHTIDSPATIARRRIELASCPAEECLALLEGAAQSCLEENESENFPDRIMDDMILIAERLVAAAPADELVPTVLDWLREPTDPEAKITIADWRAGIAIHLAGRLSLEAALPELLRLYAFDRDWWNEGISAAIIKIGSLEALSAVIEFYPNGTWSERLYLTGVLERLRQPGFEDSLIKLLSQEKDGDLVVNIAAALATYGTDAAMCQAHEIYAEDPDHPETFHIARVIYAHRTLLGEDDATLRNWKEQQEQKHKHQSQSLEQLITGNLPIFKSLTSPVRPPTTLPPARPASAKPSVGRNDPCPCGSGKKFKKCCLAKH